MTRQLEGVKPGDAIRCQSSYSRISFDLHIVERVTKTLAVCAKASFRIDSGLKQGTGDSWSRVYGRVVTAEQIAEYEAEQALENRIRCAKKLLQGFQVTAANLAAVEALLAPQPQPEKADAD